MEIGRAPQRPQAGDLTSHVGVGDSPPRRLRRSCKSTKASQAYLWPRLGTVLVFFRASQRLRSVSGTGRDESSSFISSDDRGRPKAGMCHRDRIDSFEDDRYPSIPVCSIDLRRCSAPANLRRPEGRIRLRRLCSRSQVQRASASAPCRRRRSRPNRKSRFSLSEASPKPVFACSSSSSTSIGRNQTRNNDPSSLPVRLRGPGVDRPLADLVYPSPDAERADSRIRTRGRAQ